MTTTQYWPTLTIVSACLLVAFCSEGCSGLAARNPSARVEPTIGAPMPVGSSTAGVVHKGGLLCRHTVEARNVNYEFDAVCKTSIVVYLQTRDLRFRTPEGVAIGSSLGDALKIPNAKLGMIDHDCGVALPSGWVARPQAGTEPDHESCSDLVSEPIAFFNTVYVDPE